MLVMMVVPIFQVYAVSKQPSNTSPALVLTQALASIPSDGASHPAFFLTISKDGSPLVPTEPVNVTLSCSDDRVLSIPKWILVKVGDYYTVINASSTVQEQKSVEVSASVSNFTSSKITASVQPPTGTPTALKVTLLPDILEPIVGASSEVIVTIVDVYGKPAKARSDLVVTLSSSNLHYVDVNPRSITIPEGLYSASAQVISNGFIGTATISASSSNLKPDSTTAKVSGAKPEKITVWAPSTLLIGDKAKLFIGIVDSSNKPAKTPVPISLKLYSSNSSRLTVTSSVIVNSGSWVTLADITAVAPGIATIYAASEELVSANIVVNIIKSSGNVAALKIYSLANYFPADEKTSTILAVQMVDSKGRPVSNSTRVVNIFSTSSSVLDTANSVVVGGTNSVSYLPATPRSPGTVQVTVYSGNLIAGVTQVNVYAPQTTTLTIIAPPIPSEEEVNACLVSTNSGTPAPMGENSQILLSSRNTQILDVDPSVIIQKSSYYTIIKIRGGTPGDVSVTAQGSGLPPVSISLNVVEVKPSVLKVTYVAPLNLLNFPVVIQTVSTTGSPIICDSSVDIRVTSSNTSAITMPDIVTIPRESSDLLTYGKSTNVGKSALTLSSIGFTSLIINLKSTFFSCGLKLQAEDSGAIGKTLKVTATVTYDNKPYNGATINWRGTELFTNTSSTSDNGEAINFVTLVNSRNTVFAQVYLPGVGVVSTSKVIIGLKFVNVQVDSNIGVVIDGSGTYLEGQKVELKAPKYVDLSGIFGLLGIRYTFGEWVGGPTSKNSTTIFTVPNNDVGVAIQAKYYSDYTVLLLRVGVAAGVILVIIFAVIMIRRRTS